MTERATLARGVTDIRAPRRSRGLASSAIVVAASAVALLVVAGCRPAANPVGPARSGTGPASAPALQTPRLVVVRADGPAPGTKLPVLRVEVAATNAERAKGLMGRDRLLRDHGMVFVYPRPTERTFWMRDCVIALDIAFVAEDRRILSLATLPPGAGRPPEEIATAVSGGPIRWVIEAEAGWFERHGVRAGDLVDLSSAITGVEAE